MLLLFSNYGTLQAALHQAATVYVCVCERQEEEEGQVSVLLLPFLFRKYRTAPIIGKG